MNGRPKEVPTLNFNFLEEAKAVLAQKAGLQTSKAVTKLNHKQELADTVISPAGAVVRETPEPESKNKASDKPKVTRL